MASHHPHTGHEPHWGEDTLGLALTRHEHAPRTQARNEPPRDAEMQRALRLWLTWNRAQEQATARLFKAGENAAQVEQLLDQIDQLRAEAISLSESLLR